MAFKDLATRFDEKMNELYGSLKPQDASGQPYESFLPNNPSRNDTQHDSRFSPGASFTRDSDRLKKFLKSAKGGPFILHQQELQSANTFSETRVLDPILFTSTDVLVRQSINTTRRDRYLSVASETDIPGDASNRSPAVDGHIGAAGRLQRYTKLKIQQDLVNGTRTNSLLKIIPTNVITRLANTVINVATTGIEGIDDRPELDFDKQYYSVMLWKGFQKQGASFSALGSAAAKLRKGDVAGAATALKNAPSAIISDTRAQISSLAAQISGNASSTVTRAVNSLIPADGRDKDNSSMNGRRYFIIDSKNADRYLQNSIDVDIVEIAGIKEERLIAKVNYLNRKAFTVTSTVQPQRISAAPQQVSAATQADGIVNIKNHAAETKRSATQKLRQQSDNLRKSATQTVTTSIKPVTKLTNTSDIKVSTDDAAEKNMTFGTLSMAARLDGATGDVAEMQSDLEKQRQKFLDSYQALSQEPTYGLGFDGGYKPGGTINTSNPPPQYFFDATTKFATITNDGQGNTVAPQTLQSIRNGSNGKSSLIDFMFYDVINRKVLPFRALIGNLSEQINSTYDTLRYIGRIEKNIVYNDVQRDVSLAFRIQAFNPNEMSIIWEKINYLSTLMYPSSYADGFMVPPLCKMTIGNVYVDQPGFIRNLTYTMSDESWEIDQDFQAPMGIEVTMQYSIIEKSSITTGRILYPFGVARGLATDASASPTNSPFITPSTFSNPNSAN